MIKFISQYDEDSTKVEMTLDSDISIDALLEEFIRFATVATYSPESITRALTAAVESFTYDSVGTGSSDHTGYCTACGTVTISVPSLEGMTCADCGTVKDTNY